MNEKMNDEVGRSRPFGSWRTCCGRPGWTCGWKTNSPGRGADAGSSRVRTTAWYWATVHGFSTRSSTSSTRWFITGGGGHLKVTLDCNGYRSERVLELQLMARKAAEKVRTTGVVFFPSADAGRRTPGDSPDAGRGNGHTNRELRDGAESSRR